jgi:hypothetical protein
MSQKALPFLFLLTACAAPARSLPSAPALPETARATPARTRPAWQLNQPLMQGFLGASMFEHVEVDTGGAVQIDGDEGELDRLPVIGGGAQWKLGGERIDVGLEGMLSFSWRADAKAFAVGGGGGTVVVDVDVLLFELFGGPFASLFLGEKLRLYGGAGPLLQFADYSQSGSGLGDDGSGFGAGWYARTGLEYALPSRAWIGLGLRWSDTNVDLGGNLGELEIEGVQAVLTVSRGI